MTPSEYYAVLGLPPDSSVTEIKKAYRKKARLCHPDISHEKGAMEQFICATEAYEFLISYREKLLSDEEEFNKMMEEWRRYRQSRVRRRANIYARKPYNTFKNTSFYRTTRIFDGTTIIFSFVLSILIIVYTVFGYLFRLKHPIPGLEKPSVFAFVMLLLMGMVFLIVSFIYLKAFIDSSPDRKKRKCSDGN